MRSHMLLQDGRVTVYNPKVEKKDAVTKFKTFSFEGAKASGLALVSYDIFTVATATEQCMVTQIFAIVPRLAMTSSTTTEPCTFLERFSIEILVRWLRIGESLFSRFPCVSA